MFRVIAVNQVGKGKPSKTVDVVTEPKREEQIDEEVAQIESALQERIEEESKPTATWKNNGVELSWKAVENVRLYAIERRSSNNGTWLQIACTDRNWFVDRTIREPGCYSYRVIAQFDAAEQKASKPTNEVCVEDKDICEILSEKEEANEDLEDPMKPSAKLTNNGVEVKWTAIGNVKLYVIERRKTDDSIWIELDCVRFNSHVDQTIKEPGHYVYRIICQFKDGRQLTSSPTNEIQIEEPENVNKRDGGLKREEDADSAEAKLLGKSFEHDAASANLKKSLANQNDDSISLETKPSADEAQTTNKIDEDQSTKATVKKKPEAKVLPKRRGEPMEEELGSPKEKDESKKRNEVESTSVARDFEAKPAEFSADTLKLPRNTDESDFENRRRRRKRMDSTDQEDLDAISDRTQLEDDEKRKRG
jgi:hypothetical protein